MDALVTAQDPAKVVVWVALVLVLVVVNTVVGVNVMWLALLVAKVVITDKTMKFI